MEEVAKVNPAVPLKLTDWPNEPKLNELKQDYEGALPEHNRLKARLQIWRDNFHVTGSAKRPESGSGSKVVPKLIRKQAEWRYPSLSDPFHSSPDLFDIKPVSWEDRDAAQQNALVLNNQFNTKLPKVSLFDELVRSVVDDGTALLRTGWKFEEVEVEEESPDVEFLVDLSMAQAMQELDALKEQSPSQYATDVPAEMKQAHELYLEQGVPIRPNVTGYSMKRVMKTVANHPTVEVCELENVILDPTCKGDISKARFAIHLVETDLATLSSDKRYKNLDAILVDEAAPLSAPDYTAKGAGNFTFRDKPRRKFILVEYWGFWDIDGKGTVKPIVAAWVGNVLVRMEENPFPDKKIPFVAIPYLPVKKSLYGEPDGALLEDNQNIMGALVRGMIDIMGKSANGQTGVRKDFLDSANRRRFDNGQDYEFNPNVDPRTGVYMHVYPEIPQSAQMMLQSQQVEAESLTGVKSYGNGIGSQALGDVAAGIRGALDAASKRELSILRRIKEGVVAVARKIVAMNQAFLSEEEVIRITNTDFIKVRRDDLEGNFDLSIDISTAEEDDKKAQELAFMLQTNGNNMDPMMAQMILADIARLRKMPDLAKRIEEYRPQPDPMAVQKAQLEIKLLEAQIQNEMAQAQERMANSGLHGAKATTEEAKAANLQSDTDQKNLDYVEQESGVTQERQLQLQRQKDTAQAHMQSVGHQVSLAKIKADLLASREKAKKQTTSA